MGSYLSIVNNTKDVWQCKLGHDEAALKIAGMVIGVIGSIAAVIATAGAAAPLATFISSAGVVSVMGVSTSTLVAVTGGAAAVSTYATVLGTVSGFGLSVAKGITDNLKKDGHHVIQPGESYKWGKMTLSLWQQGTCTRVVIVDARTVRTETLYMRPIFSGATANSNNEHQIQKWLDKKGVKTEEIVAKDGKEERDALENDEFRDGELFFFYPNGTVSHIGGVWDHQHRARVLGAHETQDDELRVGEILYSYGNGTQTKATWQSERL